MHTITFSLTSDQIELLNRFTTTHGFANRSEFLRALLRMLRAKPTIIEQAVTYPFVSPKTRSAKKVLADFKKTKNYSDTFLKDLAEGLADSDYFTK